MNENEIDRVDRLVVMNEEIRTDWALANYTATMPGNIDAFLFAVFGGMF